MDIIRFTYHGKKYRLRPWFNTAVNGALWGFMFLCAFLMFFGLLL